MNAMLDIIRSRFSPTIYELPITRDYCRHWGFREAIRELLQNAIDSDSEFDCRFGNQGDTNTVVISSEGVTLPASTLLLGNTSKANDDSSIGNFGEGYKIAMLVLLRAGYGVQVCNGDHDWVPAFGMSPVFKTEVLQIHETPKIDGDNSLRFMITGLSHDDILAVRDSCLQLQAENYTDLVKHQTRYGDILRDHKNKLYVGGLYVCDTELDFGYNIKPEFLRLERDRQTVSSFDLKWLTKDMWFDTSEYNFIATMVDTDVPDIQYANHGTPELVREACYRLFCEKYPGAVAASSQADLEAKIRHGMTTVIVHERMSEVLANHTPYTSVTVVRVSPPIDILETWLRDNRRNINRKANDNFKALIATSRNWKLK